MVGQGFSRLQKKFKLSPGCQFRWLSLPPAFLILSSQNGLIFSVENRHNTFSISVDLYSVKRKLESP